MDRIGNAASSRVSEGDALLPRGTGSEGIPFVATMERAHAKCGKAPKDWNIESH